MSSDPGRLSPSHIVHVYPDGRQAVATTSNPRLAVRLAKAFLELAEEQRAYIDSAAERDGTRR